MCLPLQDDCTAYGTSSATTTALLCTACKKGFYVVNNLCVEGTTVDNCAQLFQSVDQCQICNNGFYLLNNQCLAHQFISLCKTYSQSVKDQCVDCNAGTQIFVKSSLCNAVVEINGCQTYLDATTCSVCKDEYNKVGANCVNLDNQDLCLRRIEGTCTTCRVGFYFDSQDATTPCKRPLRWGVEDCKLEQQIGNRISCEVCEQNSLSRNYKDHFYCHADATLQAKGWTAITNCAQYKETSVDNFGCSVCLDGFYLAGNACLPSCETKQKIFLTETTGLNVENTVIGDCVADTNV